MSVGEPRISCCLKQRLCRQHLWQHSSEQHPELWQTTAQLFYLIMCWETTGLYSLDTNQGHPFVAECSPFTTLLAGGLALLLCAQERKKTHTQNKRTRNPLVNHLLEHRLWTQCRYKRLDAFCRCALWPIFPWRNSVGKQIALDCSCNCS